DAARELLEACLRQIELGPQPSRIGLRRRSGLLGPLALRPLVLELFAEIALQFGDAAGVLLLRLGRSLGGELLAKLRQLLLLRNPLGLRRPLLLLAADPLQLL